MTLCTLLKKKNIAEPQNCVVFSNDNGYITNMKGCDESCERIPINGRPLPEPATQSPPGIILAVYTLQWCLSLFC